MSVMDKLINAMKFNDDDDYDDDEEYEDEEDYGDDAPAAQEPVRAPRAAKAPAVLTPTTELNRSKRHQTESGQDLL